MESFWLLNRKNIQNQLNENVKTQVCIIGGGITGIATALYLSEAGYKVTILEKESLGGKVTGHTTGKITAQHGLIYHYLCDKYGIEFARKYYEANTKAISDIEYYINKYNIECDFEHKDNYIYTLDKEEILKIEEEEKALKHMGIKTETTKKVNLPFKIELAIKLDNQAQFNSIKYIDGITNILLKNGVKIYTNTECKGIEKQDYGYICRTNDRKVEAEYVVIATQYPFINIPGFYFSKMYQSSSYLIAVRTKKELPEGMFINIQAPIFSLRTAITNQGERILIVCGMDHKTGEKVDKNSTYKVLENKVKEWYDDAEILCKWSARDCITLDKIPYIGDFSKTMPNVYVATGFNKWGMTSSHVAGKIISDKIQEKNNEYEEIFKATRLHPIENSGEFKNMVTDSFKSLVKDRIKKHTRNIDGINNDTAAIVEINGQKVGIYKDINGKIYGVKPVCTHLGCILKWNNADKTWDCHCHGSRFSYTGENINNPAQKNLTVIDIDKI